MAAKSAVTKANELKISAVGDFKKRLGGITELPSGRVVRLKNPGGLAAFASSGIIPNSLMNIVSANMKKSKGVPMGEIEKKIKEDPNMISDMAKLLDGVALKTIVEPPLHPIPELETERDDELLYVDEIEQEDKQFIFQWITGGVKDVESFRIKLKQSMDQLA